MNILLIVVAIAVVLLIVFVLYINARHDRSLKKFDEAMAVLDRISQRLDELSL